MALLHLPVLHFLLRFLLLVSVAEIPLHRLLAQTCCGGRLLSITVQRSAVATVRRLDWILAQQF